MLREQCAESRAVHQFPAAAYLIPANSANMHQQAGPNMNKCNTENPRLNATDINGLNMTSTISRPNMEKLIKAIALIMLDQIDEDENQTNQINTNPDWVIFNEEQYLRDKESVLNHTLLEKFNRKPTVEDIEKFMTALYECAEFSPECNVLSLLYINRLIAFTGLPLHYGNWRPLVFISLIVAQKVWDDKYLGNADFSFIYPFFTPEEVNKMELSFLRLLQYNVVVKPSTYAKYYFELRSFFRTTPDESSIPFANEANEIQRRSQAYNAKIDPFSNNDPRAATIH